MVEHRAAEKEYVEEFRDAKKTFERISHKKKEDAQEIQESVM